MELVLDVRRGATAEALLGALIEVGASLEEVDAAVAALGRGDVRLQVQASGAGSSLRIRAPQGAPVHETWADLRPRIALLAVDERVAELALAMLDALFDARAAVHGVQPQDVDVDPLSGPDDLADAVALAAATRSLDIARVTTGPVGHATGVRTTIEGELRLPGPVVGHLLDRLPTVALDHAVEVVDPIGASYVAVADAHDAVHDGDLDDVADAARGGGRLPDGQSVRAVLLTRSTSPTA